MIWLYAICERPDVPPLPGLRQAPLVTIREAGLTAVVSRHTELDGVLTPEALWQHERVVERLMDGGAVLPARFGTQLSEPALRMTLGERRGELLDALDRVRGRVELAVRATVAASPSPTPSRGSGRGYLLAKLETYKKTEAAAAALRAPLAALAVAERRGWGQQPGELFRDAYLVERPSIATFRGTVDGLRRRHRDARVICTGPWPPYSFVDVPRSRRRAAA